MNDKLAELVPQTIRVLALTGASTVVFKDTAARDAFFFAIFNRPRKGTEPPVVDGVLLIVEGDPPRRVLEPVKPFNVAASLEKMERLTRQEFKQTREQPRRHP